MAANFYLSKTVTYMPPGSPVVEYGFYISGSYGTHSFYPFEEKRHAKIFLKAVREIIRSIGLYSGYVITVAGAVALGFENEEWRETAKDRFEQVIEDARPTPPDLAEFRQFLSSIYEESKYGNEMIVQEMTARAVIQWGGTNAQAGNQTTTSASNT